MLKKMYDKKTVFYGPHECDSCSTLIVKTANAEGGVKYDLPAGPIYPNSPWRLHHCVGGSVAKKKVAETPLPLK